MSPRNTEIRQLRENPAGSRSAEEERAPMREVQTPAEGAVGHHLMLPVVVGVVFVVMLVAGAMLG